jgi:hypothetical protein
MNVNLKKPYVIKGKIVPASLIEKSKTTNSKKLSIICHNLKNCFNEKYFNNKMKSNEIMVKKNEQKKFKKSKKVSKTEQLTRKNYKLDFQDDIHDCPICMQFAFDRDINNLTKSNRSNCYINNSHFFYIDDIFFKETTKPETKIINTNNLQFSFALLFGDNGLFSQQQQQQQQQKSLFKKDSEIYSHYTINNTNNYNNMYNLNDLNVIVTSL